MSEKHTCCARIYTGYISSHACGKKAAYEHKGKWYCKTHHPPTVQAKSEARYEKWKSEWDEKAEAEKRAHAAATEQKRRADCYDQLVERVKELEGALRDLSSAFMVHTRWNGDPPAEVAQARSAISKPLPNTVAETPK